MPVSFKPIRKLSHDVLCPNLPVFDRWSSPTRETRAGFSGFQNSLPGWTPGELGVTIGSGPQRVSDQSGRTFQACRAPPALVVVVVVVLLRHRVEAAEQTVALVSGTGGKVEC